MIKKYVANIAKRQPSNSWVTRFLRRNREKIITRNTAGIDQNCKKADDFKDYYNYFRLLHDYIEKYDIQPQNIYNMDEKGFLLGVT
ncbi:uncharacterized protein SETTUDRAFT_76799, partial [Exserohilum turcica Et28A]